MSFSWRQENKSIQFMNIIICVCVCAFACACMQICMCVCVCGHRTWRYIWHARAGLVPGQVILGPAIDFALCPPINYLHSLLSICDSKVNAAESDRERERGRGGQVGLTCIPGEPLVVIVLSMAADFDYAFLAKYGQILASIRNAALL